MLSSAGTEITYFLYTCLIPFVQKGLSKTVYLLHTNSLQNYKCGKNLTFFFLLKEGIRIGIRIKKKKNYRKVK